MKKEVKAKRLKELLNEVPHVKNFIPNNIDIEDENWFILIDEKNNIQLAYLKDNKRKENEL